MLARNPTLRRDEVFVFRKPYAPAFPVNYRRFKYSWEGFEPLTSAMRRRRQIRLASQAIRALKTHRKMRLEERMKFAGLYQEHGLIFATGTGMPINPENLLISA
jgi:hypothetical protein